MDAHARTVRERYEQGRTMIYELRRYNMTSLPMLDRFDQHMGRVAPIFRELGIETHGAWNYAVGDDLPAHTYMLRWRDLGEREAKWNGFMKTRGGPSSAPRC
jgi:hypothetical protein